jgi:hypothetical protein
VDVSPTGPHQSVEGPSDGDAARGRPGADLTAEAVAEGRTESSAAARGAVSGAPRTGGEPPWGPGEEGSGVARPGRTTRATDILRDVL